MDDLSFLRKNKNLISKDFSNPTQLKVIVKGIETCDSLEDYFTEVKDLDFTFLPPPDENTSIILFFEPSHEVVKRVREAFIQIGIDW